ncbi:MAG: helix-turn-helix domain-containing protein [Clostridia bacterium]|nr:helix-turn-helix domain-containing protein [Clostridia bacterium]
MNSKPTQTARILDYMEKHDGITQFEAIRDLGVMRLASRISELRKNGVLIEDKMITVKNRFEEECRVKRYSLKKGKENESERKID